MDLSFFELLVGGFISYFKWEIKIKGRNKMLFFLLDYYFEMRIERCCYKKLEGFVWVLFVGW